MAKTVEKFSWMQWANSGSDLPITPSVSTGTCHSIRIFVSIACYIWKLLLNNFIWGSINFCSHRFLGFDGDENNFCDG